MSALAAPAGEQRWSTCRPCSLRRRAPASTAAGPCYISIDESTASFQGARGLRTRIRNKPERAGQVVDSIVSDYNNSMHGVDYRDVLRHNTTDDAAVFVTEPEDSLR